MHAIITRHTQSTDGAPKESALNTARYLSPFQVEKFSYLFNTFFDIEKNDLIEQNDIEAFIEKLRCYAGYEKDSPSYHQLRDLERTFFECLQDQVEAEYKAEEGPEEDALLPWEEAFKRASEVDCSGMNLSQWLNMWGRLCHRSSGISDFPIWVQLLPNIFFEVIDRDGDGKLSYDEIRNFYKDMIEIDDPATLDKVSKEGYRAMTANRGYELSRKNYMFCFANFLLGKSIYGPGKYIFGVFDNRELDEEYKVVYNDAE